MDDVARVAGLSRTTVSLVLSGKAGSSIPESTRERVRSVAMELGYVPNALASGLRRKTSDTIGLISDVVATTPFAGQMLHGAHEAAWQARKLIVLVNTEGDPEQERLGIKQMLERRVEGILYATMFHQVIDPPRGMEGVPVVLLDARTVDSSVPSVVPDDLGGARTAVQHLIEAGHRRIGMIQEDHGAPAAVERLMGYRQVLAEAGVVADLSLIARGSGDASGGLSAATMLLARPDPPTALFCFNDRMAMGAYRAARRLGLVIPNDLSIVGFDNHDVIAPWLDPPLTTVQLPHLEMGRSSMEHLLALIAGDIPLGTAPLQLRIACPLVVRESVSAPAAERDGRVPGVPRGVAS